MLVKGIVPRGYCKGVVRAIEIAKKQAHQTTPVYILGMIVHNQYIVNALEDLGIQTIDFKGKTRLELLDEINEGKVIITAHGASQKVFDKAKFCILVKRDILKQKAQFQLMKKEFI